MRFYEVLTQVIGLLVLEHRVSYQALKRRFDMDDACLADIKVDFIVRRYTIPARGVCTAFCSRHRWCDHVVGHG